MVNPYLNNPQKVTGVWKNGKLTLWVSDEFTRTMLNKPGVLDPIARAAGNRFGVPATVTVTVGTPPPAGASQSAAPATAAPSGLEELLAFGEQFDNITIH